MGGLTTIFMKVFSTTPYVLTIGSMADIENASLADVHQWFKDFYGPNNAVLAVVGDVDVKPFVPGKVLVISRWTGSRHHRCITTNKSQ